MLFLIGFIGCSTTMFSQTNRDWLKKHGVKRTSYPLAQNEKLFN